MTWERDIEFLRITTVKIRIGKAFINDLFRFR
jgi:hypothetical protein